MGDFAGSLGGLFAHPWAAAAGALLVSVPIIIHLINRLRYRRVKWAAMEFLLKAQKRVRRKLIVQQLLLLLLRCLLVLLVGLLVARFFGFNWLEPESRATTHVVILDDTPSLADPVTPGQGDETAFDLAVKVVAEQILANAALATTRQRLEMYRLSELGNPLLLDRLTDQSAREFTSSMQGVKPSTVRVPLAEGLAVAFERLSQEAGDVSKVVHVVSDFRAGDWSDGSAAIRAASERLQAMRASVNLIDVAAPARKPDDRRPPPAHDNLAIVAFTPARRIAAQYDPVEFTLRVRNNGAAEVRSVRFAVLVNGDENKGRSVAIASLPGGQERTVKVEIPLDRLGTADNPLARFSIVTAKMELPEPGGLAIDNVRHAVVEVRDKLPVLVVDGRPNLRESKDGDGTYLRPVFTAVLGGYTWNYGSVRDLEQLDLSQYSAILLLNVPAFTEPATKALEQYARDGGGVGFFLGPDVQPADYNTMLHRDGVGLFPVPLADQPSAELSDEELQARRFRISQKKLLVRDPALRAHPALAGLYTDERGQPVPDAEQLERVFGFISFKRYWLVPKLGAWRSKGVTELYTLPNNQAMADYEVPARAIADALPITAEKYRAVLLEARDELRRLAAGSEPLYRLAAALDSLLADQQATGDANEALLREFWSNPQHAELKAQAVRLRDAVKFGDPLYLAKEFGRGRVTLITTTAGETWTDWPSERPGMASFAPVMKEMASYLVGAGATETHLTGSALEFRFDPTRTAPTARRAFLGFDPTTRNPVTPRDLGETTLIVDENSATLPIGPTTEPGVYLAAANRASGTAGAEFRAAAVNVDALREGDLRRAARDDILVSAPGARLHSVAESDWAKTLRNKPTDLSESWQLVALLGLLLLAEQWLATRLSFSSAA